jgi:hypothetical protein
MGIELTSTLNHASCAPSLFHVSNPSAGPIYVLTNAAILPATVCTGVVTSADVTHVLVQFLNIYEIYLKFVKHV